MRILYVEDHANLRRAVQLALAKAHHVVTVDARGEDAVARVERGERFDLIILDHHMPGLHGAPLVAELRRLLPGVPIFALTGLRDQARAAGYTRVIEKPASVEELVAAIRAAMNGGIHG